MNDFFKVGNLYRTDHMHWMSYDKHDVLFDVGTVLLCIAIEVNTAKLLCHDKETDNSVELGWNFVINNHPEITYTEVNGI